MLKQKQKALAELMATQPTLSKAEYAAAIDISEKTVYNWQQLPEFTEYLHVCCERRFRSFEKEAIELLFKNANKGNQKAIEYLLNYIGYKPTEQQEISMDATIEIDYGE